LGFPRSGESVHKEKNEQENKNVHFQQKLEQMDAKLQQLNEITIQLSNNVLTKEELLNALAKKENTAAIETDVEMTVVNESASYAKQLINLLEQAALNFVKEKQAKNRLQEEIMQTKRKLARMTQLKQHSEEQIAKQIKAKERLKDQLVIKETELLAKNEGYRSAEIQKKQFEVDLKDARDNLKQMNDELNKVKEQLATVSQEKEQLMSEVSSLYAIINKSTVAQRVVQQEEVPNLKGQANIAEKHTEIE